MKWIKLFEDIEVENQLKNVVDDVFNNLQDQVDYYLKEGLPIRIVLKKIGQSYKLLVLVKMVGGNVLIRTIPLDIKIKNIIKKSIRRFNIKIKLDYSVHIGGDVDHYIYSNKTYDPSIIYDEKTDYWRDGRFNAYGVWTDGL